MRRMISTLVLFLAVATYAQERPPVAPGEHIYVTVIDLVADVRDAKGLVPAGLAPADFVVLENGVPRTVVGVEYLRASRAVSAAAALPAETPATVRESAPALWQNVLYFETTLANAAGRASAAKEMLKHVDRLVQMGTVDVIFANPIPVALVSHSRDAAAVRAALQKVAAAGAPNQLAAHRRQYLREVGSISGMQDLKERNIEQRVILDHDLTKVPEQNLENDNILVMDPNRRAAMEGSEDDNFMIGPSRIRPYIDQEVRLISNFRDSLVSWLSFYPRRVPRNLFLVTDGFDLDPVEFYGETVPATALNELRTYVSQSTLGNSAARMAEALVAGSWTAVSIPGDNYTEGWVDDSTVSGIGRASSMARKPVDAPKAFFYRPHDPLHAVAEVTGGKVVPNIAALGELLTNLDDRVKITYQVDRRPDSTTRKVEIKPRDTSLTVRTARFVMPATPDDMARTRATSLLNVPAASPTSSSASSAPYKGDLVAEGVVEWTPTAPPRIKKSGTIRVSANIDVVKRILPAGAKGQFRISFAVKMGNESIVLNRAVPDYDLADGVFRFRTPFDVPPSASSAVLVIEETTSGIWGSTVIDLTEPEDF